MGPRYDFLFRTQLVFAHIPQSARPELSLQQPRDQPHLTDPEFTAGHALLATIVQVLVQVQVLVPKYHEIGRAGQCEIPIEQVTYTIF